MTPRVEEFANKYHAANGRFSSSPGGGATKTAVAKFKSSDPVTKENYAEAMKWAATKKRCTNCNTSMPHNFGGGSCKTCRHSK